MQAVLKKNGNGINPYLLDEILSWYGGMGSFNDLMISGYNNHLVNEKDEETINNELDRIRNQIYQEVVRLKRDSP